ncbi:MAG: HAMP domain-containing histidine kinase [Bacteroides sp.]|nr:HAMP domain-containing histidine kinase [Bacteroides sp.]MBQ8874975.1 HAMP domain-containing histidine kinase [Bacteroides sp.]
MKLFYRVLMHLLVGIVVILVGWAVVFYMGIMEEINDEVDDSLEDYTELIITRSLAGKELPAHDSGSNNQYYLREVEPSYALSRPAISYRDSMVYISEKKETEPARILTTLFKDKEGTYFEVAVYTPSIEKKDLRQAIFQLLVGLFVSLLVAILLINIWVFRRSMRPFYRLVDWLDHSRLGKKNVPLENPTHTTEFRKLNEAVMRYATHSEEVFEQQKQFIGNASHELQTPLAICQNRLEMLMEDETLSEPQMEEILKTYQTLEYVSKLNKSLLLLSKIDNSQFVETSEVCINEILHRYVDDYREVYDYRGIRLTVEEKGDFRILMNETLAVVLVTNLLKNAFVHNIDKGEIRIVITSSGIRFGNTGNGEPLDGKRIFERFYQGKKKEGSTGLGLAIVDAVCRQYQLRVSYSAVDGMHCFEISR